MANVSNQAVLEFSIPQNGIVDVPGFSSFFSASDWDDFESRFKNPEENKEVYGKENLFYLKEAGAIILRPDLAPIDMDGEETFFGYKGTGYGCYGGSWEKRKVVGSPECFCEFQKEVKDKEGKVVSWYIHAGENEGKFFVPSFAENQGICFWIADNVLPENEKKVVKITLAILDSQKKWKEGVYIEISDGKDVSLAHTKTVKTKYTIPPKKELRTQWESFSFKKGKKVYDWPSDVDVFCLFFVDRFIVFSLNGVDNYKAVKCQYYDVGKDENGVEYPVLLNSGASLWIEGKGQALLGWKKNMYKKQGSLQTKLVFPSYHLADPKIEISKKYVFLLYFINIYFNIFNIL